MNELAFADIKVGDSASLSKTVTEADVVTFAGLTMDYNPVHIDTEFAKKTIFKERIVHGILSAGFISAVLGTQLPGPNSIYLSQDLKFTAPVRIGDTVTARVTIIEKREVKQILILQTTVTNQHGEVVVNGTAVIKKCS
ncbi:acyl dehydratase [Desulfosporosinus orientis DSM 765]|uniref:Acyl dehydratase n=1 Tax=Desulfosporosinus orientis (strain ATCC 19365 / DSM 765 / NCIMB 8382 / VKM B-1628 / Singapore I) TaxID=768706 RepID=G7WIC3_DESOD|nr:MaoC family dehydratase [Desulfosporosinus orientis]AET68571.1 acyl dehydratase [Desulfosporosinus orientis DSM 765]